MSPGFKITTWLCVFVGAACLGCGSGPSDETEPLVERYREEARKTPNSVEAWVGLSEAYLELWQDTDDVTLSTKAEAAASEALGIDPASVSALVQLSRVRFEQGRFEDVVLTLLDVVRESPFLAEAWGIMGDALMRMGKYTSADSCYQTMYGIDGGFRSLTRVAAAALYEKDFQEAIEIIDRAIAEARGGDVSSRELAIAYLQLGDIFFNHGYLDAALDNVDRALELLPGSVRILAVKAEIARVKGELDASQRICEGLVRSSPHPHYKSMLARIYVERGDRARADSLVRMAAEEYEGLAAKYPGVDIRRRLKFYLDWDMKLAEALKLADEQSRGRRDVYAYELLARAYYKNRRYDLAWSSIALALRQVRKHPRLLYHAAVIAKAAGKDDKYATFIERALRLNPAAERMYAPF